MSKKRVIKPVAIKASESTAARMLASLLGVSARETVEEVCELRLQETNIDILRDVVGMYPWNADVANEIMGSDISALSEFLLVSPGEGFIVKDALRSGKHSLWLAIAAPTPRTLAAIMSTPIRGLYNSIGETFGASIPVFALQLSSCQPLK